MKFLGDVPQFYTQKCDDNSVLRTRKVNKGHQCNSFHEFLLSSSVKPLQKMLLKRSALFQKMVEIQYKPRIAESDQSDIRSFITSPCGIIYSSGMELLHKIKSHIDIHIDLKGRLPK